MKFPLNWYVEAQVARTITNLEKHTMQGCCVPDILGMQARVREWLTPHSTVAVGDSMTLFDCGIIDMLREGPYPFLDKYQPGLTPEDKRQLYRQTFSADTFLCSTNALTEQGELYNIDGSGSREQQNCGDAGGSGATCPAVCGAA